MNHVILFPLFVIITGLLSAFSQTLHEEDITVWKDIVYAIVDGHELKLDIAVPKCLKAPAPAIVDIPRGAWRVARKSSDDALFYAKYGFAGVFDKPYPIMFMSGEKYDPDIETNGYHFRTKNDITVTIEK